MNNTFYSNPSGLPAKRDHLDNNSSPADLLLLALECLRYPEIINITKIGYAEVANHKSKSIYRNHNRLVIDYENEVDGLKTGYTRNARYCLLATAGKSSHRMISIVLGCRNTWQRNAIVADMISNYYERIGIGRLGKSWDATVAQKNSNDSVLGPVGESSLPVYTYKNVWTTEKTYHRIRRGETLSTIAQKYRCSVRSLKRWNSLRSSRIYAGRRLAIHKNVKKKVAIKEEEIAKGDSEEENVANEQAVSISKKNNKSKSGNFQQKSQVSKKGGYIYHTVQSGDTLWHIARKYNGVTVEQLKRINKIGNSRFLKPGTRLKIKVSS